MSTEKDDQRAAPGPKHNPLSALRKHWPHLPSAPASSAQPAPTPPATARSTSPERVIVRRERKGHGGKTVTCAEGPGLAGHDLAQLSREAAKALGTGARAEEGALIVQGEQTERLMTWLAARGFTAVVRGN